MPVFGVYRLNRTQNDEMEVKINREFYFLFSMNEVILAAYVNHSFRSSRMRSDAFKRLNAL